MKIKKLSIPAKLHQIVQWNPVKVRPINSHKQTDVAYIDNFWIFRAVPCLEIANGTKWDLPNLNRIKNKKDSSILLIFYLDSDILFINNLICLKKEHFSLLEVHFFQLYHH